MVVYNLMLVCFAQLKVGSLALNAICQNLDSAELAIFEGLCIFVCVKMWRENDCIAHVSYKQ